MIDLGFSDALRIVLAAVFMLGSVQLHALIDDSAQRAADRSAQSAAVARSAPANLGHADSFDAGETRLRRGPGFRS